MIRTFSVPPYRGHRPQTILRNSLGLCIAPPTASVVGMAIYGTALQPTAPTVHTQHSVAQTFAHAASINVWLKAGGR
eukprot:4896399-Prymnesium_polylepis.3